MRTSRDVPRIKLGSIVEALDMIPHLLGFQPEESLVVMVVEGGQVQVTARVDLTAVLEPFVLDDLLGRLWQRFPAADAHLIAFTADRDLGWRVLADCDWRLAEPISRSLTVVDGDAWQGDRPDGPSGRLGGWGSRVAAEAVYHGLVARASREELAATIDGPVEAADSPALVAFQRQEAAVAGTRRTRWPALMGDAIRTFQPDRGIDVDEAARLAIMLGDPDARDVAVLAITREDSEHHRALWTAVVRRCPPRWQGYPLGVLGMACWAGGDGAMLTICLERAELLVPESSLVSILGDLLQAVVPPSAWDGLRQDLLRSAAPRVRRAACPPPARPHM